MPKFVTIGYGDQEGYDRTPAAIRDAAHAHDVKLRKAGVLMGIAGIPAQVRNPNAAHLETTNVPFMTSALPLAGFAIIEAANMAEAIDIVSPTPCAVARGVVEVWPIEEASKPAQGQGVRGSVRPQRGASRPGTYGDCRSPRR